MTQVLGIKFHPYRFMNSPISFELAETWMIPLYLIGARVGMGVGVGIAQSLHIPDSQVHTLDALITMDAPSW